MLSTGQLCASSSKVEKCQEQKKQVLFVLGKGHAGCCVERKPPSSFLRTSALMQMVFSLIVLLSFSPCPFISLSFISYSSELQALLTYYHGFCLMMKLCKAMNFLFITAFASYYLMLLLYITLIVVISK